MLRFRKTSQILLVLMLGLNASNLLADDRQEAENRLQSELQGRIITLKTFDRGNRLHFKSDGTLVDGHGFGPWTLYASVEVSQVLIHASKVEIQGKRVFKRYDDKLRKLVGAYGPKVSIEIDIEAGVLNSSPVAKSVRAVFLAPEEKLEDRVPSYWRQFLQTGVDSKALDLVHGVKRETAGEPTKPLNYDTPPMLISHPHPDYPVEARGVNFQGGVLLSVGVDEHGRAENIMILKPLGMGLDENAVEAVEKWIFKPAMRGGKPVSTNIMLEVAFHL